MSLVPTNEFQGSSLECARHLNGLELDELSEKVGIDSKTLARFEAGGLVPTDNQIQILASALRVRIKFFTMAWIKPPAHAINIRFKG